MKHPELWAASAGIAVAVLVPVKFVITVLLALCCPLVASAQRVVIVPPTVHVDPPITFQDLSVGYRFELVPTNRSMTAYRSMNGFALRAVGALPFQGVDLEGEMSGAWGYDSTQNLVGHSQISIGARFIASWIGNVRPFVVVAPLLDSSEVSSSWSYAVGVNGGVGLDVVFPPGLVSFDVRGGQTWDLKATEWSGWQMLATVSIGIHVEPQFRSAQGRD